ncbi:MAG: AtpZ/AtpI family protein [Bacteroidales bacterium]
MGQDLPNQPKKQEKKPDTNPLHGYARYTGLGIQMVVIILVTVWGGRKLDSLLNLETPVFTIVLSLLGVFAAIYTAIKDFIK